MKIKSFIIKLGEFFGRPHIFFYACIWLMFLLVAGTLAQRSLGLYQAQLKYFSCFITWFWYFPLPGGYTAMGIIFLGLLSKLLLKSHISKDRIGIIICHSGGLALLFGGFLTGAFSEEGNMVIPEGNTVDTISDYHKNELAIINTQPADHDQVTSFGPGWLTSNKIIDHEDFPFNIQVISFFQNATWVRRVSPDQNDQRHGFAKNFDLQSAPLEKESEQNTAGLVFRIDGLTPQNNSSQNGIYAIFEHMQIPQTITVDDATYVLSLRRARTHLPFRLHLIDFEKKLHPATGIAKSYKSVVNVIDQDLSQRTVIQMNEPLRYKGYTFYQSSFIEGPDTETTVLSVVKNVGMIFPYVTSIIMCLGLIIHLFVKMPKLFRKTGS